MFRGTLIERHDHVVDDFRWRTREPSRIEGFSDAVFGFALTLLIVSLEVPKTSAELFETMRGFGGFVLSFTMLASIWYAQFLFFRRYGLEDRRTVMLNLILLFTVLFFVYPMKFLINIMIADTQGKFRAIPVHDRALLLIIFGLGMAAVFIVFLLLYRHAYNKRDELELNEIEIYDTRVSIQKQTITIALACTYFGLAGVFSMPHHTPGERRMMLIADGAVSVVMVILMVRLFRLRRARKAFASEWRLRVADAAAADGVRPD